MYLHVVFVILKTICEFIGKFVVDFVEKMAHDC